MLPRVINIPLETRLLFVKKESSPEQMLLTCKEEPNWGARALMGELNAKDGGTFPLLIGWESALNPGSRLAACAWMP